MSIRIDQGKVARLSSTQGPHVASNILEADQNTFCQTLEEQNPWVEIDLLSVHHITSLRIFAHHMDGEDPFKAVAAATPPAAAEVESFVVQIDGRILASHSRQQLASSPCLLVNLDHLGQVVRIRFLGKTQLKLSMVEVYGVPPPPVVSGFVVQYALGFPPQPGFGYPQQQFYQAPPSPAPGAAAAAAPVAPGEPPRAQPQAPAPTPKPQPSRQLSPFMDYAHEKTVTLSSVYEDPAFRPSCLTDGREDTNCHTKLEASPWALVDLGGLYAIAYVEIVNRSDGKCLDRLGQFKVFLDGKETGITYKHTDLLGKPPKLVIPVNAMISNIEVRLEGKNYLHLCAIRAFGVRR